MADLHDLGVGRQVRLGDVVGDQIGAEALGLLTQIVDVAPRLLAREDPRVGELIGGYLSADGVQIHTAVTPTRADRDGDQTVFI